MTRPDPDWIEAGDAAEHLSPDHLSPDHLSPEDLSSEGEVAASEGIDPRLDAGAVERMVEALLFAALEPLSVAELARRLPDGADVGRAVASLKRRYQDRGVQLACVADRWRFATAPDLAFLMTEERAQERRLSKAAMETLAIIAYHQPVTRADIEAIRGVGLSQGTLDLLLEIGWVRMRGRRRTPGRPVTFGTSDGFLEHFGLAGLSDLPGAAEMKAQGLLSLDLPHGFNLPDPARAAEEEEEDPLDAPDQPEFSQDFLAGG